MTRIAAIDGLRAVSILLVLGLHGLDGALPGGYIGVDIFFVISGFLITSLLAREWDTAGSIRIGAFFKRRIARIWPAFGALLVFMLVVTLQPGLDEHRMTVLVAALSVMNWARTTGWEGGLLSHTWSLSAEEQFYLIWPMALAAAGWLRDRRTLAAGLAVAIVAVAGWRALLFFLHADPARLFNGLDTHCDGLLIGCLLAVWKPQSLRSTISSWWACPAAVLAVIALTQRQDGAFMLTAGFLLVPICAAWLIWAAIDGAKGLEVLSSAPARWLGTRSYSLYLWHWPVFKCLAVLHWNLWTTIPVELAISVAVAELSYRLIERPFLRLSQTQRTALSEPASGVSGAG